VAAIRGCLFHDLAALVLATARWPGQLPSPQSVAVALFVVFLWLRDKLF